MHDVVNNLMSPVNVTQIHLNNRPLDFKIETTTSDVYKLCDHDPYTLYALTDIDKWYLGDTPYSPVLNEQRYFVGVKMIDGSIHYTLNGMYNDHMIELCSFSNSVDAIDNLNRLVLKCDDTDMYNQIYECTCSYINLGISMKEFIIHCLRILTHDDVFINTLLEIIGTFDGPDDMSVLERCISHISNRPISPNVTLFKNIYEAIINSLSESCINPSFESANKITDAIMNVYHNM